MLIIGHSHLFPLIWANNELSFLEFNFLNLLDDNNKIKHDVYINKETLDNEKMELFQSQDEIILYLSGNEHNIISFSKSIQDQSDDSLDLTLSKAMEYYFVQIKFFLRVMNGENLRILLPPPPTKFLDNINQMSLPEPFSNFIITNGLPHEELRLNVWKRQCELIVKFSHVMSLHTLNVDDYINRDEILSLEESSDDGSHTNTEYGKRILRAIKNEKNPI
jgi:hypothetical protein